MVLDRLFLWIFTIACVVGTFGIILQAPTLYDDRQTLTPQAPDDSCIKPEFWCSLSCVLKQVNINTYMYIYIYIKQGHENLNIYNDKLWYRFFILYIRFVRMATVEVCLRFRFYSISTGTLHSSTKFQGFLKHLE